MSQGQSLERKCDELGGAGEARIPSPHSAASPRCNLPDGFFQVTARGVAGASIFVDDHDRQAFFLLQQQGSELWGWRVHAWCQMGTQIRFAHQRAQPVTCPLDRQRHPESSGELEHDDFLLNTENRSLLAGRHPAHPMHGIHDRVADGELHNDKGSCQRHRGRA